MKVRLGDYFIEADERQYKVRKHIGKDKNGKDLYKSIAYCNTFSYALKFISEQTLRDNDDVNIIIGKLTEIMAKIRDIEKYIRENENYKDRYEELDRYISMNYEKEVM